jgi:plasma kallikrein
LSAQNVYNFICRLYIFFLIQGDGGGPLICAIKDSQEKSQQYIQVGIVSWGIGCGENVPGVYSSVEVNSQWINKELKMITQ